jgi:glycosyltransferase involved in cell wall biosynthesis
MEGWGLPVSEALWCGTPALAADIPALREAGQGLALYFNPEKPEELSDLIQRLIESPSEYQALKTRITNARPSMRTWRDVARDIVASVDKRAAARDPVVTPRSLGVR